MRFLEAPSILSENDMRYVYGQYIYNSAMSHNTFQELHDKEVATSATRYQGLSILIKFRNPNPRFANKISIRICQKRQKRLRYDCGERLLSLTQQLLSSYPCNRQIAWMNSKDVKNDVKGDLGLKFIHFLNPLNTHPGGSLWDVKQHKYERRGSCMQLFSIKLQEPIRQILISRISSGGLQTQTKLFWCRWLQGMVITGKSGNDLILMEGINQGINKEIST